MPEFTAPGVYVAEISLQARSIDAVSTSTDGLVDSSRDASRIFQALASAPEWTDGNGHDPGVTALEMFGWTADFLAFSVALALGLNQRGECSSTASTSCDPPP